MHASRIHINGTTKFYFMHYLCEVIILFITDLFKSAFSAYSFKRNIFFCVLCILSDWF